MNQELLKEYVHYDPLTGIFKWIKRPHRSHVKIGDVINTSDCNDGYLRVQILGKAYRLHRLAFLYMTGRFPDSLSDHINGIRTDNRWENLREATYSQNCKNIKVAKNNTLGVKGVFKSNNGWVARAMHNKKYHYLGFFKTMDDASKAYTDFIKKVHGEFYTDRT
jgi:hypothetical protein